MRSRTADRAVGARLGGADRASVRAGAPPGRVRVRFEGSAGQSFGAFLAAGVELDLVGEANDYVGKAMGGGRIVIAPPRAATRGEAVLDGQHRASTARPAASSTVAGRAGERFAVRNSRRESRSSKASVTTPAST